MQDPDADPSLTLFAPPASPPTSLAPSTPSFPSASAVFQAAAERGRTVYGPAVLGTMRVEDPAALVALVALRAPEVPRPPPVQAPVAGWIAATPASIAAAPAASAARPAVLLAVIALTVALVAAAAVLALAL
jgi:hypothetical protein